MVNCLRTKYSENGYSVCLVHHETVGTDGFCKFCSCNLVVCFLDALKAKEVDQIAKIHNKLLRLF